MGSLFKPKTPDVEDPAPLPDEETEERARRRRIAKQKTRKGRASTDLSSPASGAGTEFSRTLLG